MVNGGVELKVFEGQFPLQSGMGSSRRVGCLPVR